MKTSKITNRVHTGEAVLAAAKLVDTASVAARLTAFADIHKSYAKAQAKVEAAVARAQDVLKRVTELDAHQDDALEKLVRRLVFDGKPRANPLAGYDVSAPSVLKKTAAGEEAVLLVKVASAVRHDSSVSTATRVAADAVEEAAKAVLAAHAPLPGLEAALREARHIRDHTGDRWDEALRVLRIAVRFAETEGAAGLYDALFGRSRRRPVKRAKPEAAAEAGALNPEGEADAKRSDAA